MLAPNYAKFYNIVALFIYWWGLWELIVGRGYLEYEHPIGVVRPRLKPQPWCVTSKYCGPNRTCRGSGYILGRVRVEKVNEG